MKTVSVVFMALAFLLIGFANVLKHKKETQALRDAVSFIAFARTELSYRTASFDELYTKGKENGYKRLVFNNGNIFLDCCSGSLSKEFTSFIQSIGTTDIDNQVILCDEYKERFTQSLDESSKKEREKMQVNAALSVLGAICVIIFFV